MDALTAGAITAALFLAVATLAALNAYRLARLAAVSARARADAIEGLRRSSPLIGKHVLVNTPKPDDQSVRGVVTRELEPRGLVLTAAVYLERDLARGEAIVREVPAGDVVVPLYSWAQIVPPPAASTQES